MTLVSKFIKTAAVCSCSTAHACSRPQHCCYVIIPILHVLQNTAICYRPSIELVTTTQICNLFMFTSVCVSKMLCQQHGLKALLTQGTLPLSCSSSCIQDFSFATTHADLCPWSSYQLMHVSMPLMRMPQHLESRLRDTTLAICLWVITREVQ